MDARRTGIVVLVLAAVAGPPRPISAQTSTQAGLEGQVVDGGGNPLPGVTVVAASPTAAIAPAGTVTDGQGRYRFLALPPSEDYVVRAELPGFAKVEIGPLILDPGRTTTVGITLVPSAATTERVTVVGRGDLIDLTTTKTATVFNAEFIEGLPILGRTYQDILTLAPGVTDVDGDGNPNVNGARETNFQTRLDGANVTDPFSGTFGQNLNIESIAELEVITTGASAEFGQAQGGFANIITKSGGNDFEGSFKFFFRSNLFDNDGANNNDVTDTNLFAGNNFTDFRPFLTVGGPIVRDHLWYFVALEYIDLETPVNTLTTPVLRTVEGWNNFGKITWQVSPSHRLSLQANQDPARFEGFGVETGVAPESDFIQDQGGITTTARWTYNLSPSALLETLVSRFDTRLDLLPATDPGPCLTDELGRCNPFTEDLYTVDVHAGTVDGPYFQTSRDTRLRDTLKSDLSWFLDTRSGTHNLKTGIEITDEDFENSLSLRTLRFDDFTRAGFGGLGTGGGGSLSGSINFEESLPSSQTRRADRNNYAFYVQDSWKPLPNLSLNLGLRFDREEATSTGFEPFDPVEQAEEFLELYSVASGKPEGSLTLLDAFVDAQVLYDVNGDGKDPLHCSIYDLDGDALGDGMPDGASDDFFTYFDGDFDGTVDCDSPFDVCLEVPDGIADGQSIHPLCDRLSDDAFSLVKVFSRHQFDETAHPYQSVINLDPDRGLPGTDRAGETFTLVNNNVAPRLSVSWDPIGDNRTKIFASWSRFYDKLFLASIVPELGPDPRTTAFDANSQSMGVDAIALQTGRFSVTQVDRGMKTPFSDEITLGFERELAPEWSILFTFVRREGRDQLQDVDLNHYVQDLNGDGEFDDNFGRVGQVDDDGDGIGGGGLGLPSFALAPDRQPDLFAFNPFFNRVMRVGNFNTSDYTSYQLSLTRRLSRRWQMTGSYVYSRSFGDAEEFLSPLGNDPAFVEDEDGPLNFDMTHRVILSGVTFLPGNQTIGGTVEWTSGLPYSLILQKESADSFGSFSFRTIYPTGQRNDQRNEPAWLLKLLYRKSFTWSQVNAAIAVEVDNLLNSDDLRVFAVDVERFLGVDAERRFGRRWQLSAQFHF